MVLVDTSVWVSHLRDGNPKLAALLNDGEVMCHRFIIGEIACGNVKDRITILHLLQELPLSVQIGPEEALHFIETHDLMGKGLGYVDVHLAASATLAGIPLWTLDARLARVGTALNIGYRPAPPRHASI